VVFVGDATYKLLRQAMMAEQKIAIVKTVLGIKRNYKDPQKTAAQWLSTLIPTRQKAPFQYVLLPILLMNDFLA